MKYDVGVNASIAMQNTMLEGDQSSAGSRTELAYQVLRSEILRGALLPGQRLRAADLEARFSLGLTPIREALMRLGTEDLVIAEAVLHAGEKSPTPTDAHTNPARRHI